MAAEYAEREGGTIKTSLWTLCGTLLVEQCDLAQFKGSRVVDTCGLKPFFPGAHCIDAISLAVFGLSLGKLRKSELEGSPLLLR